MLMPKESRLVVLDSADFQQKSYQDFIDVIQIGLQVVRNKRWDTRCEQAGCDGGSYTLSGNNTLLMLASRYL